MKMRIFLSILLVITPVHLYAKINPDEILKEKTFQAIDNLAKEAAKDINWAHALMELVQAAEKQTCDEDGKCTVYSFSSSAVGTLMRYQLIECRTAECNQNGCFSRECHIRPLMLKHIKEYLTKSEKVE